MKERIETTATQILCSLIEANPILMVNGSVGNRLKDELIEMAIESAEELCKKIDERYRGNTLDTLSYEQFEEKYPQKTNKIPEMMVGDDRAIRQMEEIIELLVTCRYKVVFQKENKIIAKWIVTAESGNKAGLYWDGSNWSLASLFVNKDLHEDFPEDLHDWLSANDIELEDL